MTRFRTGLRPAVIGTVTRVATVRSREPGEKRAVRRARLLAAGAAIGSLLMISAAFLSWVGTDTDDGGTTAITGWGTITGDSDIAGTNLNDVLDITGSSTYRPGLLGVIFGGIGLLAAVVLAASAARRTTRSPARPHRITAAVLTVCGTVGLGWGIVRGVAPGDAGVLGPGDGAAGVGPWLTAVGGLLLIAVAVSVFAGTADPPEALRSRGIQP